MNALSAWDLRVQLGDRRVIDGVSFELRPGELVLLKNNPAYNEAWPRAVVPYAAVHGIAAPVDLPWLPNDGTTPPTSMARLRSSFSDASSLSSERRTTARPPPWTWRSCPPQLSMRLPKG